MDDLFTICYTNAQGQCNGISYLKHMMYMKFFFLYLNRMFSRLHHLLRSPRYKFCEHLQIRLSIISLNSTYSNCHAILVSLELGLPYVYKRSTQSRVPSTHPGYRVPTLCPVTVAGDRGYPVSTLYTSHRGYFALVPTTHARPIFGLSA